MSLQAAQLSSDRFQDCWHFWISLIFTLPCYTGFSVLQAYLNLQNKQEITFKCATPSTNTNMDILKQQKGSPGNSL